MATNKEMTVREQDTESLWEPFRGFPSLTGGISELFDDMLGIVPSMRVPAMRAAWVPRVDIHESEHEYIFSAAVPGLSKEDVKISVDDGLLTISGERKQEHKAKGRDCLRHELYYGSFRRDFSLPPGIHPENVKATLKDGILTVSMPRPEKAKARGISVKVE